MGDLHRFIIRVGAAQPPRDLLRRPLKAELLLDDGPQLGVEVKLCVLRPTGPAPGGLIRCSRAVARAAAVSVHLARDRGVSARDRPPDRPEALAAGEAARDLLPLLPLRGNAQSVGAPPGARRRSCQRSCERPGPRTQPCARSPAGEWPSPHSCHTRSFCSCVRERLITSTTLARRASQAGRPDVQVVRRSPETAHERSTLPKSAQTMLRATGSSGSAPPERHRRRSA